ncbi:site-specific tyrosine recombinase/integron integrase [Sulfolobus acidocaldarius]|uniref:Tyrosine recombinase XerA n=4 Tax=Sulfolobus acidocaldarius TaxID=2285 RepID=Q4J8S9_SULAC|nr:site-specific tyrosine recombinase/integron integrase [Sulfolobus acidocaldarius]AAY80811.1 integrase/recombinase XerD [Sulfolobus acidocaldarius DSM 639]AGE71410.1 integrase/recombinase XerD [Sulfolobus acidocaldarius N8]AGE73681.1 integrase/recombinase XerD [Sulfolobus acidocaldarius Ron12/I]ALU30347.1 recombinase XerD [Sulfolobus acidocaldarius]ALU31065.1 recombinase XerD [Sulfolobus acidocaldarius]
MRLQLEGDANSDDPYNKFILTLNLAGASENTIRLYSIAIKDFLDFVKKDPRQVTNSDVNAWLLKILKSSTRSKRVREENEKRRMKLTTAKIYLTAVLRFLKWLGKDVKPTVPKARKNEIRALTYEELEKLKASAKKLRDAVILNLLIDTGIRAKELLSIKVQDIDLERRRIIIRNTKNGESRIVFFTSHTGALLKKYIQKNKKEPEDKLINMTYQALYRKLRRLGKKIGIDLRPHILRHTFATEAIRKGIPLPVVQKILGHKDIRVTQVYTHLVIEDVEKAYKNTFG